MLHDTFISQLHQIAKKYESAIRPSYLYGTVGHGARFTLAMNTRTGKEIGHPVSHFTWDIVAVIEHCFPSAGIEVTSYVGPGYATRARKTAAQTARGLPDNVILLESYDLSDIPLIKGDLIYAHQSGEWRFASSTDQIDVNPDQLPFGPVVLNVTGFSSKNRFPEMTLRYLVDTIERGEEPMEIRGRGDYSAVSGWKAYARWMQSFAVPLPGVQHEHLTTFIDLLLERRTQLVEYLDDLAEYLEDKELQLVTSLAQRYRKVCEKLQILADSEMNLPNVRDCYFTEQKTQYTYKKIDTYLTHTLNI